MSGLARLGVDVAGIYAAFLSWALIQERLTTTPYEDPTGGPPRYFRSVLFLNTVQSLISALAALTYLYLKRPSSAETQTFRSLVGLQLNAPELNRHHHIRGSSQSSVLKSPVEATFRTPHLNFNGTSNGSFHPNDGRGGSLQPTPPSPVVPRRISPAPLLIRLLQCAIFNSIASPFTFASLRHIDYPTMILGKSCKLIPVMFMNVVLYRRRFALHKYAVVAMVTVGISVFTLYAPTKKSKAGSPENSSLLGLSLLLISLAVDGATNSTQDEIFAKFGISGSQMMWWMNLFSTVLTTFSLIVPLPPIPILSPPSATTSTELSNALSFISFHPKVLTDILLFSTAGALGQLFIFDTLEHFGSLTLVTITVTRKLATMLLSVVVFHHKLSVGQWVGVLLVFCAIGIEALVKRRDGLRKSVITEEKAKARLKVI